VQAVLGPPDGPQPERRLEEIDRLTDEKEDLEAELAEACRPHQDAGRVLDLSVRDVQRGLPADAVLIDFLQYRHFLDSTPPRVTMERQPRLVAFVVRRGRPPVLVPLGRVDAVERAAGAWRRALVASQQGRPAVLDRPGEELARLVWRPLAAHVQGARTVLIAPEGPLCSVPFAALPGGRPGSYLLEDFTIGYVPSGRWLGDLRRQPAAPAAKGLLGVGGIDYGDAAPPGPHGPEARGVGRFFKQGRWEYLKGTDREVRDVGKLFEESHGGTAAEFLTGKQASKERLLELLGRRWRHVHFAGHGFFADSKDSDALIPEKEELPRDHVGLSAAERQAFSRNQLLLSGLVLAGANRGRSPAEQAGAILTAEEVGGLDLRGTEMVVLSACETGLGNVAGNEGTLGLQRAFLTAGAGSVAASLWKVDDGATALLMAEFCRNLWQKKMPRLEALRRAQLVLLRRPVRFEAGRGPRLEPLPRDAPAVPAPPAGGPRSPPVLWAAFVLSGEWR
jgi:CHAT domain-containing protein